MHDLLCGSEGWLVFTSLWHLKASKICLRPKHGVCSANGWSGAKAGGVAAISFDEHSFAMIPPTLCAMTTDIPRIPAAPVRNKLP